MKSAVALVIIAACSTDNSPTQPSLVLPRGSVVHGNYQVTIGVESGSFPEEVQVLADRVLIYSGPLMGGGYYFEPRFVSGDLGPIALDAGRHTLSVRVTRLATSPTTYHVSGRVEALHQVNGVNVDSQGASWEESVTLTTGQAWTGVFEIRAWRG